jgi:hypothetical protein
MNQQTNNKEQSGKGSIALRINNMIMGMIAIEDKTLVTVA